MIFFLRRLSYIITSTAIFLSSSRVAHAEAKLDNPLGTDSIPELIGRFITILTGVSGTVALLMFVYGGFLWLTSAGNEEQVSKGKKIFTWATIGLVIIFMAYAIVNQIFKTVGAV